jgi:hypothetical protein
VWHIQHEQKLREVKAAAPSGTASRTPSLNKGK